MFIIQISMCVFIFCLIAAFAFDGETKLSKYFADFAVLQLGVTVIAVAFYYLYIFLSNLNF